MADRKDVLAEKKYVSQKISDLCRYIGFGVIAVAWTALNATSQFAIELAQDQQRVLVASAIAGIFTVLFDYLQFFFGYFAVKSALNDSNNDYNDKSGSYRARVASFWVKQGSAALAICFLLVAVFRTL